MAIYHLEAKVISRGAGRSAVAASAYLSCSQIYNDYDGIQHDYTRKRGLVWQEVFLPPIAPAAWSDRSVLWNAVEENEKTKDSRLAREFVVALPIELGKADWKSLLTEFIQDNFVADGMCADVAIHDPYPPGHNPHAHIMLTVRPLQENGKWQHKTEKEYLCVKDGEERGFTSAEYKAAQAEGWEKQYQYKVRGKKTYMAPSEAEKHGYERANKYPKSTKYGRQNPISQRWNSDEQLLIWRENWATVTNRHLAQYPEIAARIDHRSHAARGLDELPTIHEGYHARKLEAMGIVSDRCEINRQIKADNTLLRELKAQLKKLADAVKTSIPELANALETLRENMIVLVYRISHIRIGKQKISDYVDAVKPVMERYTEIKQEIKEKSAERKQLRAEQDSLSFVHVIKHQKLSEQVATLTEDLEELKSEKSMLLNSMECADDAAFSKFKKEVKNLDTQMEALGQAEAKFTAELDSTLERYRDLAKTAADVDADELTDARMELRPEKEQSASDQLQNLYGDRYDYNQMSQSKQEVKKMLGEDIRKPSVRKQLRHEEPEKAKPQTKQQRDYERKCKKSPQLL